jgi:NitT/TauT family transport system permease protein
VTVRKVLMAVVPPVVFGVLFLGLWEWLVVAKDIKPLLLPAPSAIWDAFRTDFARIWAAAQRTGLTALVGLAIGTIAALLAGMIAARLSVIDQMLTPLVAALATMPIVALAPLLNTMFSSTSPVPRRLVVAISAFVPIFLNVVRGLKRLAPVHAELMASYAASGTAVLRVIRVPTALPYFFIGLRIAASLSVIAAVVTEYFGGLQDGLGAKITRAVSSSNYPVAWASVLASVFLGLAFYLVALLAERLVMRGRTA